MADQIIGWVAGKPVFALTGGSGAISFFIDDGDGDEPDGSDTADPDDEDDDGEEDGGEEDGDTITIKRSELEALRGQLSKANREARWRREALKGLGIGRNGKPVADAGETESRDGTGDSGESAKKDRAVLIQEVQREVEAELGDTDTGAENVSEAEKLRAALLNVGVARALQEQGWVGKRHAPALRLLDLDKVTVTVTDANEVEFGGLTEQIDALKQDLPTLFKTREDPAPTRRARPRGGVAAVDGAERPGDTPARARKGWKEQIGSQLATGRRSGR